MIVMIILVIMLIFFQRYYSVIINLFKGKISRRLSKEVEDKVSVLYTYIMTILFLGSWSRFKVPKETNTISNPSLWLSCS